MKQNRNDDKQECFLQQSQDFTQSNIRQRQPSQDMGFNLYKQLPPNELRNISRPETFIARTLTSNKQMSLLPDILNHNCEQKITKSKTGTNKIKITNKEKLSLEEFFNKRDYRQVYNRLNHFPSDSKNFSGKLLSVDSVADYNHKLFRQLDVETKQNKTLIEDSIDADFESGNLCKAFVSHSDNNDYFLIVENDANTYGYNIWFFFRFRNLKKGPKNFYLANMIKKTDNYKKGMQISIFSMNKYKKDQTMWFKGGDKINFGQTNFPRTCHLTEKYHCLSFQYDFQFDNDEVYFAMNQPYTYTRMSKLITKLEQKAQQSNFNVEIKRLGHTLADNVIPGIKIWKQSAQNKETILITARQHPCETVSSFVCQGMINHLMTDAQEVKLLLQKYQVFIIPMVNPDGVIHGSSRCNLAGFDLNRQWSEFLIKQFTPQTHRIKKYLSQLHKQNPIRFFFDLHGHGKKLNSFFFSCKKGDNPSNRLIELVMNRVQPRFSILDCTYGIDRDKENTVRSQLHQLGVGHCYTLETSLMGYVSDDGEVIQFAEHDLFSIGVSVWKGIFVLDNKSETVQRIFAFTKEQLLQSSQNVIAKISQKQKDENKKTLIDDNASDSDPEGDILDINQRLQKCCKNNLNLKKKITDTIKKQKVKKKKLSLKSSTKKQQRKTSSNTQPQEVQKVLTAVKIENQSVPPAKLQQNLTLSQEKQNIKKMSINNKRTTVYSRKVREKDKKSQKNEQKPLRSDNENSIKNSIHKNRNRLNSSDVKSRMVRVKPTDVTLKTFPKNLHQSKTSCSIIYEYPNDRIFNRKKVVNRIKTQSLADSAKNIPGVYYHDLDQKPQNKYCELKQESLKALLTDTFSVLKIRPKLSIKKYAKPSQKQRSRRMLTEDKQKQRQQSFQPLSLMKKTDLNSRQRIKTFSYNDNISQRSQNNFVNHISRIQSVNIKIPNSNDFKYKRFQNFIYTGATSTNSDRLNSSVFYYFPVL